MARSKVQGTHVLHEVLLSLFGEKSAFTSQQFAIKELFQSSESFLLEKILNLGNEYYQLKCYIKNMQNSQLLDDSQTGLYVLSFTEHLDQVLEPYWNDVVELEQEMLDTPQNSLHYVWSKVHRYAELLSGLNCLVNEIGCQNARGCMLLQHLQERLSSDVGAVRLAVQFLIQGVNKIFFRHISNWLLCGDLVDSYDEFFIQQNHLISHVEEECTPFVKFSLNCQMLPNHIRLPLAEKILNVGQTVLFLRSNPENTVWKDSPITKGEVCIDEIGMFGEKAKQIQEKIKLAQNVSKWNENGSVDRLVAEVSSCVTLQLWTLAVHEARLVDQLHLVKEFFLLGRGELFHEFVTQTDRHKGLTRNIDLNQILQESAVKVLMKEECLQKFSLELVKSPEDAKLERHEGLWFRINVKYDVPWPLQLLFTSRVLASYNNIFRFLLRLKRIQVKMVDCWLREKSKRCSEDSLKRRQLQRNLWFLINNLQYYLHVDVLDSQFMIFETAVEGSKDFDEIVKAHTIFLENLISQLFIHVGADTDSTRNPVFRSMSKMIELCEEYCREVEYHGETDMSEELVDALILKFEACVEFLLKLLTGLTKTASHPCSRYLSQFLLRLDFNSFFSNQFSSNLVSVYV